MTYRSEHTVEFLSLHTKKQVKLDMTRLGYKRLSSSQAAQYDAITIEDLEIRSDDKHDAIRGRRISTRLIGWKGFSLSSLYSENPRQYRVDASLDGTLTARSYLLTNQSEEPYVVSPYVFGLSATVGLGDLKDIPYLDSAAVAYQVKQSAMEVLLNCLDLIGLELPTWVVCNSYAQGMDETICPLSQTIINPLRYYPGDQPMTAYEVLQDLCTLFGAYICQSSGYWKFIQVEQLTNATVTVWPFDKDRKAGYPMQINIEKVIASGVQVADKPFINYDQRISNYDSVKLAQMEVEYGDLKNWLYNARFQILDPRITGGFTARGWRFFGLNYSFVAPDPQTVFKDNYLRIEGQLGNIDYTPINIPLVGNRKSNGPVGILNTWDVNSPVLQKPLTYDDELTISLPTVIRYDQIGTVTGEFFNVGTRGAKFQVVAVPILNQDVISPLRSDAKYPLKRTDLAIGYELFYTNDGLWRPLTTNLNEPQAATLISRTVHIFENTREVRETAKEKDELGNVLPSTNREITIAKGEWSNFSIETEKLPIATKDTYNQIDPIVINGTTYKQFEFYALRVVVFRGVSYEDPKPSKPNPPSIQIRNLKVGVRNSGDTSDIRKERFEVEQDKPYGIKRDVVTLPLGSVGGENYYSQLLDTLGNPQINWYNTSNRGKVMPLPALTLTSILKVNGRPTKRVTGSVLDATFDLMDQVKPGGLKGKYMLAGVTQNFPSEQSQVVLAELHEYIPSHNRRYYTVNGDGKQVLQDTVYEEGDIPDTEADILITFLEPNGPNGNKLTINGSLYAGQQVPAHWATFAWFDKTDEGPYTVTVQSLRYGEGILDYQKVYPAIDHQFQEIEIPRGIEVYAIVTNASGATSKRKVLADYQQKLHISTPGTACQGDFPAVTGVLQNALPPVKDWRGRVVSFESYTLEVVNLRTGEVIVTTPAPLGFDSKFAVQVPDEWDTDNYGLRITSKFVKDVAGNIGQITRCKPKVPNFFAPQFSDEFYKEVDG